MVQSYQGGQPPVQSASSANGDAATLVGSNDLFLAFADLSPDAIVVAGMDMRIVTCNMPAARLYGSENPAALVGRDALTILAPEHAELVTNAARVLLETGTARSIECDVHRYDGTSFPAQVRGSLIINADGKPTGFICVARDITEWRRSEQALEASEGRYRELFERNLVGLYRSDAAGRILECNDALAHILGCESREELLGCSAEDFYFDPATRKNLLQELREKSGLINKELCLRHRDGSAIWVLESSSILEAADGVPVVLEGTMIEITQRKRTEEALRESEDRFQKVARATNDVVYDYDITTGQIWWNEGLQTQLGYKAGECSPDMAWWTEQVYPTERDYIRESLQAAIRDGREFWSEEYRFRRQDGTYAHILDRGYLIRNEAGVPVRMIGSMFDITLRKQAEIALAQSERRHRALMEQASDGIVIFDMRGNFVEVNSRACLSVGYEPEEFVDLNVRDILSQHDVSMLRSRFSELYSGKVLLFESQLRRKDGSLFDCEISTKMLSDRRIQAICRDITERKRSEEALRNSESRYRHLFEHNLAGVYRTTFDGAILDCNEALVKMLGYSSRDELLEMAPADFFAEPSQRHALLSRLLENGSLTNIEICYLRKDGSALWVLENIGLVESAEQGVTLLEGTVIDITERKLLEQELTYQAFHDGLTGLPNRALFMDRLGQALARATRAHESVAVLFLDLDNFKVVNDSLGHKVGDYLLVSMGKRLLGCVRAADTVARLGGDEFTLLIENVCSVDDAIALAHRIADVLVAPFNLDGRDVFVNTSIGIAVSSGGERPDDILRNADLAMYSAKNSGKARYAVYEPALNRRVWERLQSEMELRHALEADELVLHYQPVVQLHTGAVVEVEALVRWQHRVQGLLPPSDFIPLAEETGLILPLGQWVLKAACKQVRTWQLEVEGASELIVSVNLSPRQFRHPRLVEDIKRALAETGLAARHLKLEITESAGLDNSDSTIRTLHELKAEGIQIAIDDFGTGYSALSYLKHYPIDSLKLDRSFISGLGNNLEDTAIIHAVIAFARTLNLKVIAEGIETAEQLAQLRELGCSWGQGYYFARPLTSPAAYEYLTAPPAIVEVRKWGAVDAVSGRLG
ncbi:MAG: PAS domain S-box protein [Chloroflexota bacterium]